MIAITVTCPCFVSQVLLKLLARIDYGRNRGALRSNAMEDLKRKKFKRWVQRTLSQAAVVRELGNLSCYLRPPAKLFDPEKIRAIGGEISNDGDFMIFEGNKYSRKGFLYKNFVMNAILAEGVKPTLAELER